MSTQQPYAHRLSYNPTAAPQDDSLPVNRRDIDPVNGPQSRRADSAQYPPLGISGYAPVATYTPHAREGLRTPTSTFNTPAPGSAVPLQHTRGQNDGHGLTMPSPVGRRRRGRGVQYSPLRNNTRSSHTVDRSNQTRVFKVPQQRFKMRMAVTMAVGETDGSLFSHPDLIEFEVLGGGDEDDIAGAEPFQRHEAGNYVSAGDVGEEVEDYHFQANEDLNEIRIRQM